MAARGCLHVIRDVQALLCAHGIDADAAGRVQRLHARVLRQRRHLARVVEVGRAVLGAVDGIAHVLRLALYLHLRAGLVHQAQGTRLDDEVLLFLGDRVVPDGGGDDDAAAPDLADFAAEHALLGQVAAAQVVGVPAQLVKARGVRQQHLFAVLVILKQRQAVGHRFAAHGGHCRLAAVAHLPQHAVERVIHRVVDGVGQLPGRLAHRVAVTGKPGLIGDAHRLGVLFHRGRYGIGAQHARLHLPVFLHLLGLADIAEGGELQGIAGLAHQAVIRLGQRQQADPAAVLLIHHVADHLGDDHVARFRYFHCLFPPIIDLYSSLSFRYRAALLP